MPNRCFCFLLATRLSHGDPWLSVPASLQVWLYGIRLSNHHANMQIFYVFVKKTEEFLGKTMVG